MDKAGQQVFMTPDKFEGVKVILHDSRNRRALIDATYDGKPMRLWVPERDLKKVLGK